MTETEAVEIIVTSSRIPTPIDKVAARATIIDAEAIAKAGVSPCVKAPDKTADCFHRDLEHGILGYPKDYWE